MNTLYYGDNLDILRRMESALIDLIYLDPPFNSNANYNILFGGNGKSQAQIRAFNDTWHWGEESEKSFADILAHGGGVADLVQSLRQFLGENDMMAYLAMMVPRLIELCRVLKPTGSMFLHCDPTASHYLKIVLDAIFGVQNFRNEIVWHYRKWPTGRKADLAGADFTGADLRRAILIGATMQGGRIAAADLTRGRLSGINAHPRSAPHICIGRCGYRAARDRNRALPDLEPRRHPRPHLRGPTPGEFRVLVIRDAGTRRERPFHPRPPSAWRGILRPKGLPSRFTTGAVSEPEPVSRDLPFWRIRSPPLWCRLE